MDTLVPVGRLDEVTLKLMCECGFVQYRPKPVILTSGKTSRVYVSGRDDLTDNLTLLHRIGREVLRAVLLATKDDLRAPCLIGIPTAGTPLAQAAAMIRFMEPDAALTRKVIFRVMRETLKTHGAHHSWVNGPPEPEKHVYCVIDNVVTDGSSKIETAQKLEESGYPPRNEIHWFILVDRGQGALENLRAAGIHNVTVIFTLKDIIAGFARHGFWTAEMAQNALSEFQN